MKNRKRWLSVILALAMVFTLCITPAAAVGAGNENGATVTVEKVTGEYTTGSEVTLTVSIAGNPGFAGYDFQVIYKTEELTLKEITQGTVTGGTFMPNVGKNKVVLANTVNLEGDGTLFTLKFTVNEAGVDGAAVSVNAVGFRNAEQAKVPVNIVAGGINDTTGGGTTGGSTTGGSTTGGSTTGGSTTGGNTTGGSTTGGSTTGGSTTGGSTTGGSTTGGSTTGGSTTGGSTTGGSTTGGSTTGGSTTGGSTTGGSTTGGSTTGGSTTGGSTTGGSTTGGSTTGGSTTGGSTTGGSTTGGSTTGGGTTGGGTTGGGSTGGGSSSGSGSSYTSGMSFTTDLPADSITRVTVNGKKLDSKYYTVSSNGSGSIVTLTDAYLATLKAGTYTIKIESATHVSTGTFTIKADGTPKTADAGIALYAVMAVSSLMGTAVVSKKCRKA